MPSRLERWLPVAVVVAMLLPVSGAAGQEAQLASRGPRFLLAGWSASLEQDASGAPVLRRRVSLDLTGVTLDEALKEITRQGGLEISYSPRVVPVDRPVSLHAREITVAAALTEVLLDAAVDVSVARSGQLALVQRVRAPLPAAPDTGAVSGRVTDATTGAALVGATVSVDGARQSGTTDANGRYRIAGLTARTYTVRARYIGYTPARAMVEVRAGEEVAADFSLTRSAQELNQVVVTGTIVPTEVKALPTPVSVIDESDVASQRPHSMMELFRQAVPTAVSWDDASVPYYTAFSVRGASTLGGEIGQMKVLIDGVEVASPSVAAVDPNSIARVEVIRGPQAAAIYGSDAIGGVIQIFTKRGDSTATRPQVEVGAALGLVQTPYPAFGGVLRQNYTASVRGGGPDMSYNFGGGYGHTADYLPAGELSRQSNPSVYGGIHVVRGIISADVSGRYYTQNNPIVANPGLAETGFFYVAHPFYEPQQRQNQTIGARVSVVTTQWWRQTVTLGFDRATQDIAQSQPRRTYAGDTLLTVVDQAQTKAAVGYNSSVSGRLRSGMTGSLAVGFDHYSLPVRSWSTTGALNTSGSIQVASGSSVSATRTLTNNTGYFAQMQLGYRDALFLTAGIRAEQNSSFGDSLGTPVSPRVGLSYVRPIGEASIKLRASWGEAIRAPSPSDKLALVSAASITLANPTLGPERQKGWDAGVDAAFGDHASLSLTYYDQIADNLIQFVRLQGTTVPTFQAQNVGRVKNRGVEVEGMLSVGPARVKANYGYVRARVEQLAPNYTGDLQVGDQTLITPRHTAGASLTVAPFARTMLSAGLTYVGSWNNYNYVAFYSCFGGTGPCQPTSRGYIGAYPGFVKLNAGMSQQITRFASGFVSVDNLTNNQAFEASDLAPVIGRITTVGLQLRY